jgi:hypothetical protein
MPRQERSCHLGYTRIGEATMSTTLDGVQRHLDAGFVQRSGQ